MAEIPIFPLNMVLYPGGRLPLRIFEVRYVDMTKACIRDDAVFGVCQILDGEETGKPAVPATVGCTARITQWEVPSAGLFSLVTTGETVFRIRRRWTERNGLTRAEVDFEESAAPEPLPHHAEALGRFLDEIMQKVGRQHFPEPHQLGDCAWVCHRLAEIFPLSRQQKLWLLELRDPREKVGFVEQALGTLVAANG